VPVIGFLAPGLPAAWAHLTGAFRQGLSAAAWPLAAFAQQQRVPSVGVLNEGPPSEAENEAEAGVLQGLAEMGFIEGHNVVLDPRFAYGHVERLPALAADLVLGNPSAILVTSTIPAVVAKAATRSIPIVFEIGGDPIELGLVESFNRPGGNITRVAALGSEISAKRLELLRKLVTGADAMAMLVGSADSPYHQAEISGVRS
jgi:putative tryptophan/tyrosine transport system substrate-binding protein